MFAIVGSCLAALHAAAHAQPLSLVEGSWRTTIGGELHESSGFSTSFRSQEVGTAGSVMSSPFYSPLFTPPWDPYRNLPALECRGVAGIQSGTPAMSVPYSIDATIQFTLDRAVENPMIAGSVQVLQQRVNITPVRISGRLTDSDGQVLFEDSAEGFQNASISARPFTQVWLPGVYELSFSFVGVAHLGEAMGHAGYATARYEMWVVTPAPGSVGPMMFAGLWWTRRSRRACA